MSLVEHARATFLFAKPRDYTLVRIDPVTVEFSRVGCLGQCVADRCEYSRVPTKSNLCLQSVVVRRPLIRKHVDLADAVVHRNDGPGEVGKPYIFSIVCGYG